MRPNIRAFAAACGQAFGATEPVYEFGSWQVEGQEAIADLRTLFPGKKYVGCDMQKGKGVDRVENVEAIGLPDGTAGTVLFVDTVEHVEHPHKAVEEIHRLLKPGGILAMSSVMDFPIHNYPHDYWRFTPEGFKSLMRPFGGGIVGYQGDPLQPHTVFAIGMKGGWFTREAFDQFLRIARREMKTGTAPSPFRVKWLRRLTAMPLVARRERFCQMIERHVDPDKLHFEVFSSGGTA